MRARPGLLFPVLRKSEGRTGRGSLVVGGAAEEEVGAGGTRFDSRLARVVDLLERQEKPPGWNWGIGEVFERKRA